MQERAKEIVESIVPIPHVLRCVLINVLPSVLHALIHVDSSVVYVRHYAVIHVEQHVISPVHKHVNIHVILTVFIHVLKNVADVQTYATHA